MEAQQKRLLKKLGKGLAKDVDPNITNKKLQQCFENIVQNLPSGTDIKHGLNQHYSLYLKFFIRCVRKACIRQTNTSQPTAEEDKETVSAADQDHSHAESSFPAWLSSRFLQNLSQSARAQFTVQKLHRLTDLRRLSGIVDQFEASSRDLCIGVEKFSKLLALTAGSRDLVVLKKIMQLYFNALQEEIEHIISSKSEERTKQKEQALREFLQLCHFRRSVCEQDGGDPSYTDLLASLLSLYLDLFLVSHGGDPVGTKEQHQVCSFIHHLMPGCDTQIFDVILQVTAANQENAGWLLPLVRKILKERRSLKKSHGFYFRFVLAVRMWGRLLDLQDITAESHMVRAPKHFMEWLLMRNPLLLEELPTDRKFKGRVVTAFILDDASDNVFDMLLDALIDTTKGQDEQPSGGKQQGEEMDIDGDLTASNTGTSGRVEEGDSQGMKKKKKKKKMAKKSVLLENGIAPDDDESFVVDRGESSNLSSKFSKYDGATEDSPSLFFLDRGVEKTATENNINMEPEENQKKIRQQKQKMNNAGPDSTIVVPESSQVPGNEKKNSQNASNRSHVEDVGQTSEVQNRQKKQGITNLFVIDRGDNKKQTKDSRLLSPSFHSEDVIEISDLETNGSVSEPSSVFVIDGGDKRRDPLVSVCKESRQVRSEKTPRGKKASTTEVESGKKKTSESGKLSSTESATNTLSSSTTKTAANVATTSPKKSTGTETAVMTKKRTVSVKSEPVSPTKPVQVSARTRRRTASEKSVDTSATKCSHDVQLAAKLKSSKRKLSSGAESNSMDEDFQIITDSATDTVVSTTRLTHPAALESGQSALTLKLRSDKATLLSDIMFSEVASESGDDISQRVDHLVKRLSSPAKSSRVEASVTDSEEEGQRPIPNLKVHLKPQSPKKGAQIDQSEKEDIKKNDGSCLAADTNKKEIRQKRKFASVSQTSHDEMESNAEGEIYFSPVYKRKGGEGNVPDTGAKQSVKALSPVKVSSSTKTPTNSSFTEIIKKKRNSTTPVTRRARSRKEDSDTPSAAASLKKMTLHNVAGGEQTEITSMPASKNHDSESEIDFPKIISKKKVMVSKLTVDRTPRTGKLLSPSKKGSTLGSISKKADCRKSPVATRLRTDTSAKKDFSRRKSTGMLQSKKADDKKSSKDIREYLAESSKSGALPQKVTEAEETPQSSPKRLSVESFFQEMREKKHTPQKSSPKQSKLENLEEVTEKKPLKSSLKRHALSSPVRSSPNNTASPSQKQLSGRSGDSSDSDAGSHIIETRSKASQKGYNLRRSSKFQ